LQELSSIILNVDEKSRRISVKDPKGFEKILVVEDDKLLRIAKLFKNKKAKITYGDKGPYGVLKEIKGDLDINIHGLPKSIENEIESLGIIYRKEEEKVLPDIDLFFIPTSGDDLLFLIGIIVAIIILAALYFLVISPLLLIISSIFTLGEAWKMRRSTKFTLKIDSANETLSRRLEQLLSITIRNKAAMSIIPEGLVSGTYIQYAKQLRKIFKLFRYGFRIQIIVVYIGIILAAIIYYYHIPITTEIKMLAFILGGIFLAGLFLVTIAGHMRRSMNIPLIGTTIN